MSSKIKMKKQHIVCDRLEFHCGDHIDNDYKVEKLLGAGTFGCVYKVEGSDGTPYALKLLKLWEIPSDERAELLKRFDMEYDTGTLKANISYIPMQRERLAATHISLWNFALVAI